MKVITPPNSIFETSDRVSVFLAGSIEMDKADHWQRRVIDKFSLYEGLTFYNPRRDDYQVWQKQTIDNHYFRTQVEWELDALKASTFIFMYFDPNTQSPISLLEFGMYFNSKKLIVVSPHGFWRRGNLEVCCTRSGIYLHDNLDSGINELKISIEMLDDGLVV